MQKPRLAVGVLAALGVICAAGSAQANLLTNGDFETGDFTGWTIQMTHNGQTYVQQVVQYDIDGPGPLGMSPAANFWVGQVAFESGVYAGIELVQNLALTQGAEYTFDADVSVFREAGNPNNGDGGKFEVIVDGAVLATWDSGSIVAGEPEFSHLTAAFTPAASGNFVVGLRITRKYLATNVNQYVDNVVLASPPTALLGDLNCDGVVDGGDVGPFSLALLDPTLYAATFPLCDINSGDINGDGAVNNADLDPFVQCLLAGGCP